MVTYPTTEQRLHHIQRELLHQQVARVDARSWFTIQAALVLGANVPFFAYAHEWQKCIIISLCAIALLLMYRSDKKERKRLDSEMIALANIDPYFRDLRPHSSAPPPFHERLE